MKRTTLAAAAVLALSSIPGAAFADLSFNVGAVTDYRFRGISQTTLRPAIQGGADYSHESGLYVGTWLSNIKWIKDAGDLAGVDTKGPVEVDLYGGYKGEIVKETLSFDVGGLYYYYPTNKYGDLAGSSNANTFEVYGALTWKVLTVKYSYATTNTFGWGGADGAADSKGSGYLDVSANFDLGNGYTLTPHIGHQDIRHFEVASYNDYALTVGKDFGGGLSGTVAVVATDADKVAYAANPAGKFQGRSTVVVGVKYSF